MTTAAMSPEETALMLTLARKVMVDMEQTYTSRAAAEKPLTADHQYLTGVAEGYQGALAILERLFPIAKEPQT
jgi:hypothetical protein